MKKDPLSTENAGTNIVLPDIAVDNKIYIIRGQKVMLDSDLAFLYEIETKALNQAARRNIARFPSDFMFQLNDEEQDSLRSQIVILKSEPASRSQIVTLNGSRGSNIKYNAHVFTELGIAMLSSVLRSKRAIQVNIQIMRAFTHMRHMMASNTELWDKIDALEQRYDEHFKIVFDALRELMEKPAESEEPKERIGYDTD